ncbi:MAG: FKBP-type peptidyl-prolyl cis-trans isomerase [Pseudomonadales bacterium]|nr:FKBP-type peptidyl-prolyl cis-trans isomerase [Pseudomonadales bacterium]
MSDVKLESNEEKVSYGFGLQFGQQLSRNNFDGLSVEAVAAGISDILSESEVQVSEEDLNAAYSVVQEAIQAKEAEKNKQMVELSKTFLDENAKRDGVITLESGLQYEILETGEGDKPGTDASVKTHYHGTFIDGKVFDSSVDRGEPATFGVTQVIAGWTEALQLMPTGSKWRLFIPSDLAYGDAGSPPSIPGGTALIFEIHLIEIV